VTLYTLRFVRENEKLMREALRKRQYDESILDQLLALDEQRRKEVTSLQELNTRRNELTSVVSKKKKEGTDASEEIELLKKLKERSFSEGNHSVGAGIENSRNTKTVAEHPTCVGAYWKRLVRECGSAAMGRAKDLCVLNLNLTGK